MAKKLPARAEAVKQAHADLSQRPGFRDQRPAQQFRETQKAARKQANAKGWGNRW